MTADLLNRWTSSYRRAQPPAPRADLRVDILQFYDAEFVTAAPTPRIRRRPMIKLWMSAAAAVLLGLFVLFATRRANVPIVRNAPIITNGPDGAIAPAASIDSLEARRAILISRAEAIKKTLAASSEKRVVSRPDPIIINKDPKNLPDSKLQQIERTIQSVATHTSEPVEHVYRLVAARLFENVDKQSAIDRYHELIRDYPTGAACGVANQRLQALLP